MNPFYDEEDLRQDAALLALEYDSRWASRKLKVLVRRRRQEAFAQYRLRSFDTPIRDGGRPLSDTLLPTVLPPRIRTGRIGRPRTRQLKHAHCTVCGCLFYYRCSPGRTKQRVACSPACARCLAQRARQILPTDGSVERRYVLRHWSTPKLAKYYGVADPKVVRDHLVKRGVKLRRHTVPVKCVLNYCHEPAFKIRHAGNGCRYGRLCRQHWKKHRAWLSRVYKRKVRG